MYPNREIEYLDIQTENNDAKKNLSNDSISKLKKFV